MARFAGVFRAIPLTRVALVGLCAGLLMTLSACFDTGDGATGPTTDTGGAGSNTVVTLAPPPPPVAPVTGVIQQPPAQPPDPPAAASSSTTTTRAIGTLLRYTINPGDTLSSVARQFGVTLDDLIAVNNIANPDAIRAGEELIIPPPE